MITFCPTPTTTDNARLPLFTDVRKDNKAETLQRPLPLVEYQEVHTTFVCGVVDRSYFGLRVEDPMPASVLLTESATHLPFSSLARHSWLDDAPDGVGVYKLFSRYVAGVQ